MHMFWRTNAVVITVSPLQSYKVLQKTRVLPNMTFMRASLTNTSLKYALQEQTVLAIANLTGH